MEEHENLILFGYATATEEETRDDYRFELVDILYRLKDWTAPRPTLDVLISHYPMNSEYRVCMAWIILTRYITGIDAKALAKTHFQKALFNTQSVHLTNIPSPINEDLRLMGKIFKRRKKKSFRVNSS